MKLPSRPWRVAGILGLLAWSLSAVPDRVAEQREAVARLASERGAASAGGALLAVLDDLERFGGTMGDEAWWIDRTRPVEPLALASDASWTDRVEAVRRQRAARAVQSVAADAEGAVLVDVDGDLYLVLAQAAAPPLDVARGEDGAALAPDPTTTPVEASGTATGIATAAGRRIVWSVDEDAAVDGHSVTIDGRGNVVVRTGPGSELAHDLAGVREDLAGVRDDLAGARGEIAAAAAEIARELGDVPGVRVEVQTDGGAEPTDALEGLLAARDAALEARDAALEARDAARTAGDAAREAGEEAMANAELARDQAVRDARDAALQAGDAARTARDGARPSVRLRTPEVRIPAIEVADVHIPEVLLPPFDLVVDVAGTSGLGAFSTVPVQPGTTALVAWWPPVQARVEALSGVPLQVDGSPPRARSILPAYRLSGLPVWSLPTPEAEAAFDLFDGGSVLWMMLLGGLLAREYVTWRREDAQERERQLARDGILQRLSHELRTPAASVRTLVDALDHPGTSDGERAEFLLLVRSEAERLANGIDRLLQAARGDTALVVEPIPLDLAEWAEGVRQRWLATLPDLRVEGLSPCPVVADPERLDEAVDALLDNARKYGGPTVTLTVGPDRIVVEDDGEGVPQADRGRVMKKFERVEGRVNDPGGHGLGLWAVSEVARAHGGRLTLEGPSRFVLTLGGRR